MKCCFQKHSKKTHQLMSNGKNAIVGTKKCHKYVTIKSYWLFVQGRNGIKKKGKTRAVQLKTSRSFADFFSLGSSGSSLDYFKS